MSKVTDKKPKAAEPEQSAPVASAPPPVASDPVTPVVVVDGPGAAKAAAHPASVPAATSAPPKPKAAPIAVVAPSVVSEPQAAPKASVIPASVSELPPVLAPMAQPSAPPPPDPNAPRRYRVWQHGELHRNGVVYRPGDTIDLTAAVAAGIGACVELVE